MCLCGAEFCDDLLFCNVLIVLCCQGANLSEETVRAGKNLDDCLSTLIDNFSEGSDYFKVLVNVFQSVLLSAEHDHLKTFFMIVPALCISWVEASLVVSDQCYVVLRCAELLYCT